MKKDNYMRTNRAFSVVRIYGRLITVLVAVGGLWQPKLGLLVILIMAALTITSFFTGRYWCGNFCPHGSLFDVIMLPLSRNKKIPDFLYSKAMIVGFFIFFMFNFSRKILKVMQLWGEMVFLDRLGFVFVTTYLMVLIAGGLLAIFISPRTWCRFCPMGSMQKMSFNLGKALGIAQKTERRLTITNQEQCLSCGKCARVCPFQLTPYLEFSGQNQFDNIDCIKCATCVAHCPVGILSFTKDRSS